MPSTREVSVSYCWNLNSITITGQPSQGNESAYNTYKCSNSQIDFDVTLYTLWLNPRFRSTKTLLSMWRSWGDKFEIFRNPKRTDKYLSIAQNIISERNPGTVWTVKGFETWIWIVQLFLIGLGICRHCLNIGEISARVSKRTARLRKCFLIPLYFYSQTTRIDDKQ